MDHLIFLTYIPSIISGIYWLTYINNKGINRKAKKVYNMFFLSYSALVISASIITYVLLNINNSAQVIKILSVIVFIFSAPMVYFLGQLELQIRSIKITKKLNTMLLIPMFFAPVSSVVVLMDSIPMLTFGLTILQVSFIFLPALILLKIGKINFKDKGSVLIKRAEVLIVIAILSLELLLRKNQLLEKGIIYSLPLTYLLLNIFNLIFKDKLFPFIFIPKISFNITPKEREVIKLLKDGLGNKEIAYEMNISFSTVKNHIYHIYKKTGAQSRIELIKILNNSL